MNLPEAKEILSQWHKDLQHDKLPNYHDALKLGIEALAFLVRWRNKAEIQPYPLLPSETEE